MRNGATSRRDAGAWWALLVAAAFIRLAITPYGGYPGDIAAFSTWAAALAHHGPSGFYERVSADYLPGFLYVLWAIGLLSNALQLNEQALLVAIKLPAVLADLVTAVVIRRVAERLTSRRMARIVAASYLFHPALIFTSAYWGQADSVGAAFASGALALFLRGHPLTWAAAAAAFLVKPQTAPLIFVLGLAAVRRDLWPPKPPQRFRPRPGSAVGSALLGGATIAVLIAPFGLGPLELVARLRMAYDLRPYGSILAFNLWGAFQGFLRSDAQRLAGLTVLLWGMLATAVALTAVFLIVWRHPGERTVVLAAATALVATFLLPTRIHERYLVFALPLLALACAVERRVWPAYGGLSILQLANLVYAYTRPFVGTFTLPSWLEQTVFARPGTLALSAAAVLALPWLFRVLASAARHADAPQAARP